MKINETFLFAPMEGLTGFPFRCTHRKYFPGVASYFTPFLVANQTMRFKNKEMRDVLPENNGDVPLVPQILTNKADQFVQGVRTMTKLGYTEINLNLGCPMPMQMTKRRGAGFLEDPDELDRFFDEVFRLLDGCRDMSCIRPQISVKTRIGVRDAAESGRLMEVYNRYPISRLIVHARRAVDFYRGLPDREAFGEMLAVSRHPVCYNGDLFSVEDIRTLVTQFPDVDALMIGRGLLQNPALVREYQGGAPLEKQELQNYVQELFCAFREVISGDVNVMYKMKEMWGYLGMQFVGIDKELKQIRKAKTAAAYESAVARIFEKPLRSENSSEST